MEDLTKLPIIGSTLAEKLNQMGARSLEERA